MAAQSHTPKVSGSRGVLLAGNALQLSPNWTGQVSEASPGTLLTGETMWGHERSCQGPMQARRAGKKDGLFVCLHLEATNADSLTLYPLFLLNTWPSSRRCQCPGSACSAPRLSCHYQHPSSNPIPSSSFPIPLHKQILGTGLGRAQAWEGTGLGRAQGCSHVHNTDVAEPPT